MPSVIDEKLRKFFSFDLGKKLLLNTDKTDMNSEFKNCKEKMFWTNANLNKLKSIHSSIIYNGTLKATTNFNKQKKSYYFVLKKYYDDKKSKILLESYKNETMNKLKFVVDLDFVDQIDLRLENEKTIVLTKSEEICTLDAETKNQVLWWLNLICKHCGFNEVLAENEKKNKTNDFNKSILNQPKENCEINSVESIFLKPQINNKLRNFDINCLPLLKNQLFIENFNENATNQIKEIAGDAAQSVGSFDFCSLNLDKIFTKQVDELKFTNKQREDNYLHLDQFSSGSKNQISLNEIKKQKNFMLSNNLVSCQSFSSLNNYSTLEQKPNSTKRLFKNQNISASHNLLDNQMFTSNSIFYNLKSLKMEKNQQNSKTEACNLNQSTIDLNNNSSNYRDSIYISHEDNLRRSSSLELQLNGDYINVYENQKKNSSSDNSESFQVKGNPKLILEETKEKTLKYVPLEIVTSAQNNDSKEKISEIRYNSSENLIYIPKFPTMNIDKNQEDDDRMYTDWDMMRTLALKNAHAEFQKPNFL